MKSERRHELQQNSLVRSLENLPKMGRDSGSKLLLGIVTVLLVIVLIRFYLNNRDQKQEQIATQLANARVELTELQGQTVLNGRGGESAAVRNDLFKKVEGAVDDILTSATDGPHVAEAKNIRGDAYLQMATFGQPPEATTRPDLALPRKQGEMLDEAAKSYQDVLEIKNGVPPVEVANARFGLAAVAEDRGEWDKARRLYETVRDDAAMPAPFAEYAKLRLSLVDKISTQVFVGEPTSLPTMALPATASTEPTTNPTTNPSGALPTLPATEPMAPTPPATTSPAAARPAAPGVAPLGWTAIPTLPAAAPAAPTTAPTTAPATTPTTRGS